MEINPIGYGETVEHLAYKSGGVDDNGFKVPAGYTATTVNGVGVDIASTSEPLDGTVERADVDLVLFLPPGFQCDSKDRFRVRGKEYRVIGIGEKLPNFFTGSIFRTEVKVKRYDA